MPLCFNRAVYDQGFHDAKKKLGSGRIRTHEETGALNDLILCKLVTNAYQVAWPSGLRRWFKAPVSSEAWVRVPPLPI